jgi:DNA-directed RNA polymerase subunit D
MEIDKKENKIKISAGISASLANAIRRSSLEIPILAIDEVEFRKNDSVLYDEVLALRLGLLPLKTPDNMNLKEDCKCKEGCSKCELQLKLKAKGPGVVYGGELGEEVVYPKMPLTELKDKQKLELIGFARLGRGIDHTKYSPGLIYYSYSPEIKEGDKDTKKRIIEVDKKDFEDIKKGGEKAGDFIGQVVNFEDNYLEVKKGKELNLTIESWGQIPPEEILEKSIEVIKNNLKEIKKAGK